MENWTTEILKYLYRHQTGENSFVDISEFLLNELKLNGDSIFVAEKLNKIFEDLYSQKYLAYDLTPIGDNLSSFGNENKMNYNMRDGTLRNYNIRLYLRINGYHYIEQQIRDEKQDTLLSEQSASIIATNESVRGTNSSIAEVNLSIKDFNEKTIPQYNPWQHRFSWVNLSVAGISVLAVIATAYIASQGTTGAQYDETNKLLRQQQVLFEKMQESQRNIGSSLQVLSKKKDTVYMVQVK